MKYLLIALALSLTACAKDHPECPAHQGQTRLIAFGDSQTAGHATESEKDCGYSYANILAEQKDLTLINTAVPGSRFTDYVQSGYLKNFKFQQSDTVIMLIGFNDMRNFNQDPAHLAEFKSDLTQALLAVSPNVQKIVIGTCLTPLHYDLGSPEAKGAYRQAVHDIVTSLGLSNVTALEVGDSINQDPSYFVADELHLNLTGQAVVAQDFQGAM